MSWKSKDLRKWLTPERSGGSPYWHLRLREVPSERPAGLAALQALIERAHEDALKMLQEVVSPSLDPLAEGAGGPPPPGSNYPHDMYTTTLQGYMGEIIAGLIAENFEPLERQWEVPAFTFRGHDAAMHLLEARRLTGRAAHPIPGRFGTDCLAFQKDGDEVIAFLTCEAKCTHDHRPSLISEGHTQLSDNKVRIPVDLIQLIQILRSMGEEEWASALSGLLLSRPGEEPEHCDLFVYVCGRGGKKDQTWMDTAKPHPSYEVERQLESAELQFNQFDGVLEAAYPGHSIERRNGG